MALDSDFLHKIKRKKHDEVEAEWLARMDSSPDDLSWFTAVAREMRATKSHAKLSELLLLLVDGLATEDRWELAFDALSEGLELMPRNREFREKAEECVRARYSDRSGLEEVMAFFVIDGADSPVRVFGGMRDWLRFEPGAGFYLFGRGLGKVAEVNLALQKVQLKFEKTAPLVVRRDEAKRLLTWIPAEHFMMRRLVDVEAVRQEARSDPGAIMREILVGFGRPLVAAEIRECLSGVLEGAKWSSWWSKAKSHPQVLPSRNRKNAFVWSDSSEAAELSILTDFDGAPFAQQLELARKHVRRGGAVRDGILRVLVERLNEVAPDGSVDAVEICLLLEELEGLPDPSPISIEDVLAGPGVADLISQLRDRRYREKLYARVREVRPDDWQEVYQTAFKIEPDLRILGQIYEGLRDAAGDGTSVKLVAETLSNPRKAPRAFVWVTKNVLAREELRNRANHGLLSKIIDALDSPEFKDLKVHLRESFEPGGIAFVVFEQADREGVEHLLNLVDSAGIEEHRKTEIRRAIFRRYPHIRKRAVKEDVVYATAGSASAKRRELEQLVRVEIPENAEAIRVAREHGDLRENFEYHAARQKHELLNSRAAQLHEDLGKIRIIDPDSVNPERAEIGTRIRMEPTAGGATRIVTILGPWDSDPARDVYSYQSEIGQSILEKQVNDSIMFDGAEHRVSAIEVWRPSDNPSAESLTE